MKTYWTNQMSTPATDFSGSPISLKFHYSDETYYKTSVTLVQDYLTHHTGPKSYVHARPIVNGKIVGNTQAWCFPQDGVLVIWECLLTRWRGPTPPPAADTRFVALWKAFEQEMIRHFQPKIVLTPAWEPEYPLDQWHAFLTHLGYTIEGNMGIKHLIVS